MSFKEVEDKSVQVLIRLCGPIFNQKFIQFGLNNRKKKLLQLILVFWGFFLSQQVNFSLITSGVIFVAWFSSVQVFTSWTRATPQVNQMKTKWWNSPLWSRVLTSASELGTPQSRFMSPLETVFIRAWRGQQTCPVSRAKSERTFGQKNRHGTEFQLEPDGNETGLALHLRRIPAQWPRLYPAAESREKNNHKKKKKTEGRGWGERKAYMELGWKTSHSAHRPDNTTRQEKELPFQHGDRNASGLVFRSGSALPEFATTTKEKKRKKTPPKYGLLLQGRERNRKNVNILLLKRLKGMWRRHHWSSRSSLSGRSQWSITFVFLNGEILGGKADESVRRAAHSDWRRRRFNWRRSSKRPRLLLPSFWLVRPPRAENWSECSSGHIR